MAGVVRVVAETPAAVILVVVVVKGDDLRAKVADPKANAVIDRGPNRGARIASAVSAPAANEPAAIEWSASGVTKTAAGSRQMVVAAAVVDAGVRGVIVPSALRETVPPVSARHVSTRRIARAVNVAASDQVAVSGHRANAVLSASVLQQAKKPDGASAVVMIAVKAAEAKVAAVKAAALNLVAAKAGRRSLAVVRTEAARPEVAMIVRDAGATKSQGDVQHLAVMKRHRADRPGVASVQCELRLRALAKVTLQVACLNRTLTTGKWSILRWTWIPKSAGVTN